MLEQNQGELLLFSPKRDELAWARKSILATVHTCRAETQLKATSKMQASQFRTIKNIIQNATGTKPKSTTAPRIKQ